MIYKQCSIIDKLEKQINYKGVLKMTNTLNTNKQFKRFEDIVSDKLEILKNIDLDNIEDFEINEIMGVTIELTTMIFTTVQMTEIKEIEIDNYIKSEIGLTIDDLQQLENSFY